MSGLDIDHSGPIAVDTEQLRDIGRRMQAVAEQYEQAQAAIGRAFRAIASEPEACPQLDTGALQRSGERIGELRASLDDVCAGTLLMADAFELVELRAKTQALALTDAAAAEVLQSRIDQLLDADARIEFIADSVVAGWEDQRFEGLARQFDAGGLLLPLLFGGAFVGVSTGLGKVANGVALRGRADPVQVTPVKTSLPVAPQSLADTMRRIPSSHAQIAVEKYTMADGATRYVTYIAGTKSALPWAGGKAEPWDMKSNAELYRGYTSASYQATVEALAAAGAEPGDRVDVVAHSQGGMIAAHLAMQSEYDVIMQQTAGSPQESTLSDDQTLIQLRHSDDVVSTLAAGGFAFGVGSADSFTATRVGDAHVGLQDARLQTHAIETYIETAEMVDISDDPRAEALDDYWAELAGAVKIERTEFHAERIDRP